MRKLVIICYRVLRTRAPFDPGWASRIATRQHATWFGTLTPRTPAAALGGSTHLNGLSPDGGFRLGRTCYSAGLRSPSLDDDEVSL